MRTLLAIVILGATGCVVSCVAFGQDPPAQTPPAQTPPAQTPPAQTPPAQTPPAQSDAPKPDAPKQDTSATSQAASPAPSPVPSSESWITGSIAVGYRWVSGIGGSSAAYRSLVDLGSGPKLTGADFTITDPKHRLFDQIHVRAANWGDDPYQTAHLDASKAKVYSFSADYRDIAYFDMLPSYADPLLSRGIVLNEQSFDTRRHFASVSLNLFPGNWIQPYFAFDHDSGSGTGETTFVTDANEFPVPNQLRDMTNLYRAGVHIERRRFHVTLEEGGTTFKDDQSLFQPSGTNLGNVNVPIFGQTIDLTSLLAAYGVNGSSTYSKGYFTSNPASWIDIYGQFLFSQPQSSVNYQQYDTGNLLLQSQILFYTSQQFLVSAAAKMPHTSGSFGTEIRPMKKMRITESWLTDRLHDAGSASTVQTLTALTGSQQMAELLASSLANNYNQAEMNVFYDVTNTLMLRGGYRYVWGDASDAVLPPEGLVSADQDKLRRNVGLGGFRYRPIQRLTITAEGEGASSGGAYFRTSLYDYQKARAQARFQAFKSLSLAADFNWMNNSNPTAGVNYTYRSRQESLSLYWTGKLLDFEGSYSRSTFYSDIGYLAPQNLLPLTSIYRENAHTATGLFSLKLPPRFKHAGSVPKLSAGGSMFISAGSQPTSYFQPLANLSVPVTKNVAWYGEWRYYGYGEVLNLYEGFRAQMVTTGLRFSR